MKLKIFLISLICLIPFTTQADTYKQHQNLSSYGLLLGKNLPHLMKPIMQNQQQFNLSSEQKQQLKELRVQMAPKIHSGLEKARKLEIQISGEILDQHKSFTEVTHLLEKLQAQKWQNTQNLVNAIGQIQKILNTEQYQQLMQMIQKPS